MWFLARSYINSLYFTFINKHSPFCLILTASHWVYIKEVIGENTENPFEYRHKDVPITDMSRGIEMI